jgi:hypothetical protein
VSVTSPVYDVVMAFHVLAAVVGFGALASTGAYAAALRRQADPFASPAVLRYFAPGRNRAARAILVVPLLGGLMLGLGGGQDAGAPWPWIGLAIWTVATGIASAAIWPAEREIQELLAAGSARVAGVGVAGAGGTDPGASLPPGAPDAPVDLVRRVGAAARRADRAAAATSLLFVAALVVMVWQP